MTPIRKWEKQEDVYSLIYHNRFDYNMIKSTNDINFRRTLFYGALEMILTLTLDILVDSIPGINNNILGGVKRRDNS